ncbi:MAG: DUF1501 domain-containing protein [Pirellulaceae bacterium]|nr:DUF1501 domain-containing protein [Pirellulaceae bacterium]
MMIASRLFAAEQAGKDGTPPGSPPEAKAKAVIQIWLGGGPAHIDMFDPKPDAGSDYTGPLRGTCTTNVPGIQIGELLPELGKLADKYALIRSMTHGQNGHETAAYLTQTGRMPGKIVYPAAGAVVTAFKGFDGSEQQRTENLIPPYVVLTSPQGRFSEAGFLGMKYKPFATGGDPNAARFAVEGIVSADLSDEQQLRRREMLNQINTLGQTLKQDSELAAAAASREHAYSLMLGDAGQVFNLSNEKDELRQRYGRTTFGQSCLAARRLVEQGTKYVTINHGGWDTHKDHFVAMRRKLPELDRGLATLIADLADRGLLDSTIVWCVGEFGRTPKVANESPWNGGRHHFGAVFSALVAGGGFRGGQVVGESNSKAEAVKDRPVYPGDLIGTMYSLLGIDPEAGLPHPRGDFIRATPGADEGMESGGRLTEIT